MEKRVSPLQTEEEKKQAKKKATAAKKATAPKKAPVKMVAAEVAKPVAKRVNPITLEEPKVETKVVEKVVEAPKAVKVTKEPTFKVNNINVSRKLKFLFKLSKVLIDELTAENPATPLNVNVENAILEGLRASNENTYTKVVKALKGE